MLTVVLGVWSAATVLFVLLMWLRGRRLDRLEQRRFQSLGDEVDHNLQHGK